MERHFWPLRNGVVNWKSQWWWYAALVSCLILPNFLTKGIFLDGALYASIARNMAEGQGSFWDPYYTEYFYPHFREHPPLFFGLESIFFQIIGDHTFTERLFSLLLLGASTFLKNRLGWKKYPRQESNLDLEFRKLSFYPLNYGGKFQVKLV